MSNEIKEEKSKAGVITAVVIAIAVIAGGIMLFKPSNNGKVQEQKVATATTAPKPKTEKTVARIDISTKLVDAKKPQFEVYVDGSKNPEKQATLMNKLGIQGYVVRKDGNNVNISIKALQNSEIKIVFKGPWDKDENGKMVEHWVDYTSIMVNDEEILSQPIAAWHNKSFKYTIDAKAGNEFKINVKWKKHKEK